MESFIKYLIENIVDQPDQVEVMSQESEFGYVNLDIKVAETDMGKVIGKKGKVIDAIRKLAKVRAVILGKRVQLNLIEPTLAQMD